MKKHYLAIGAITATTLLAGCDLGDMIGLNNSSEKSEHTTSQSNQSSNKNTSDNHKNNTQQDSNKSSNDSNQRENKTNSNIDNLSQAEKVALALNDPSVSDYVINANELRNHSYFANYNGGGEQKSIDTYQLETTEQLEGAPSDMKFYNAQPAKGSFATIIGVGSDKVFIAATQSPGTYEQFMNSSTGHELDVDTLFDKYSKSIDYKKIAKQISFSGSKSSESRHTSNTDSKNSKEYFARVWLTARNDVDNIFKEDSMNYTPIDMSGEPINPYNKEASKVYPDGTILLSPSYMYLGHVIFKDNGDGTVTFYDVPSHFQDRRWDEDDYTKNETTRILNNGETKQLANPSEAKLDEVANHITSDTPEQPEEFDTDTESSSDDTSSEKDTSSDEKVTRANVIDKVEDYEGHQLDTDTYTYKEPEQDENGDWGFSILDKNGDLVGSYIVTSDGVVTKYDEHGDPID